MAARQVKGGGSHCIYISPMNCHWSKITTISKKWITDSIFSLLTAHLCVFTVCVNLYEFSQNIVEAAFQIIGCLIVLSHNRNWNTFQMYVFLFYVIISYIIAKKICKIKMKVTVSCWPFFLKDKHCVCLDSEWRLVRQFQQCESFYLHSVATHLMKNQLSLTIPQTVYMSVCLWSSLPCWPVVWLMQ